MKQILKTIALLLLMLPSVNIHCNPIVVGDLFGRLGNQCFQVATTLSHAWENDAIPVFPDLITKKNENVPLNYKKVFWRLITDLHGATIPVMYNEPHFHYSPIPYQPNMRLRGYFQSEKYFKKYRKQIIGILAPSSEIRAYLKLKYSKILDHPLTVSIHFRNYYKENPFYLKTYQLNQKSYFLKAVSQFPKDALFVVFSDDIEWCKNNLRNLAKEIIFIEGETHYHDFYLMSLCKHHIISNSSFSWWGAYLNPNPNKIVIAPKKWFTDSANKNTKDLIPAGWKIL